MRIGVLALQGDFAEHAALLAMLGATPILVRQPADLAGIAGLVLPGGESTTLRLLLERAGLGAPLNGLIYAGLPVLATCAGLILVANTVEGEDPGPLAALDISVARNAFGRQRESFETDLVMPADELPLHAVFIRAPAITRVGMGVAILARLSDGMPAAVRQGAIIGLAFHPELSGETRFHATLLASAGSES